MKVIDRIKRYLLMVGDAMNGTVRERFELLNSNITSVASRQNDLVAQYSALEESQLALLQSSIFAAECLRRLEPNIENSVRRVDEAGTSISRIEDAVREHQTALLGQVGLIRSIENAAARQECQVEQLKDAVDRLTAALQALQDELSGVANGVRAISDQQIPQVCIETSRYEFLNPEVGLLSYLRSYLPASLAIDAGAHKGEISSVLLQAGYEVYAFEPNPAVFAELVRCIGPNPLFHAYCVALGRMDEQMQLHLAEDRSPNGIYQDASAFSSLSRHPMPDDLPFIASIPVPVRSIESLRLEGVLPADVSLVKIDTEGYDLEVVAGMGNEKYSVVCAEFWDKKIPFQGANVAYSLTEMVDEMRGLGYAWHVVLYRVWGANQWGFYCNRREAVPDSWGNAVFFREYETFSAALRWCSAVLPITYFKAALPQGRGPTECSA